MPFSIDIDPHTGVCHETWTGELTVEEVQDSIRQRHENPRYGLSTPRLIDLSRAEGNPSRQEIRKLALMHRSSPYRGACALVAAGDHQFGVTQLFESIVRGNRPVRLFRSRDAAAEWLDQQDGDESSRSDPLI